MSTKVVLPERFEDDVVVVRKWTVPDATDLDAAITENVEHLRPWMPWIAHEPQTVERRGELIAQWEQDWDAGGDVVLGVFVDGDVVGSVGLHRRIGPDGLEIGYWIDRHHLGQGLATRVSALLTTGAFRVPGISRVEIRCDEANLASTRVPQKLDFTLVGTDRAPIAAPAETGTRRVYRMTLERWSERSSQIPAVPNKR